MPRSWSLTRIGFVVLVGLTLGTGDFWAASAGKMYSTVFVSDGKIQRADLDGSKTRYS